ncbi:YcaO-like family protein [Desulfobacca acetoxidans]|uniref:YcaO-domain protein n=1 Tax=Desulfobacca acetoxidans (strain ATCC 700848 / DSM 11109 / ASRB2) TaxID=880072 RepID=F2NCI0_DESAR|nr:YcaO-like family protein [Desulfobacca acetoxidans]AEB09114.1 YcaO-domain protein [Desulfobacca acetoxidans DSM 11109]
MTETFLLQDCYKQYSYDLDKVCPPEETVARVKYRFKQLNLDLLKNTLRIDSGRLGIPVYVSLCGVDAVRTIGTQKQMGKGSTPEQAEASALMELVERFSFFSFMHQADFLYATPNSLGPESVSFKTLARSLFDVSEEAEQVKAIYRDWPLHFTSAVSLTYGHPVLLPIHWFYLINEYNGPAAGNTLEEAVLQGLCEVVERHVGSVISHGRLFTPVIDPASVQDPAAVELLEKFRRQGIVIHLRDFSLDTGIPTVGVLAYDPATFPEASEIIFTAGTTPDPEKSLVRALTEVAQLAGDFNKRTSYRPTLPKYENLTEASYLTAPGPMRPIRSLPQLADDNIKVEIERCVATLTRLGLEVLVVDVTHPQIRIPVVYVIAPGAHFLERTRQTNVIFHLAKLASRYAEPEDAMQALTRLHERFPGRFDVLFFLGLTMDTLGRTAEALSYFAASLQAYPPAHEIASIYVHIGSCRKDLGDYSGAVTALKQAQAANDQLKEVYHLLGFCYFKLKEHQRAVECFEKAIELDPGSGIDYANLGINLRELGFRQEAAHLLQMALDLDPSLDFARLALEKLAE